MMTQLMHCQADTEATPDICQGADRLVHKIIDRLQSDQVEVRRQVIKKRQMLNAYQQEMLDGMPLHERLKSGNYRF